MEKMTGTVKMNENNVAIDIDSLDTVIGGTFDLDHFPKWAYEEAGFKVVYHFFARNEYIKDGKTYNHDEANAIMAAQGYEVVKKMTAVTSVGYFVRHNGEDIYWR